jgi:hypothetical protein
MKLTGFLLFFIIGFKAFGQNNNTSINLLFNKGLITYVNNTDNAYYTMSLQGDTMIPKYEIKGAYFIDSSFIQIHNYTIPKEMLSYKYDSLNESKLFLHFMDYELEYMQDTIYKEKLEVTKIFFTNNYSKRFLIWYYKIPLKFVKSDYVNNYNPKEFEKSYKYQLYFAFTANNFVSMTNIPILDENDLIKKINLYKTNVANSIRIYFGPISINILNNQIIHYLSGKDFIYKDSLRNFQITIPFWYNIISSSDYDLIGAFPDIDNISNCLLFSTYQKSNFDSFISFENKYLKNKGVLSCEARKSENIKINRYKAFFKTSDGIFKCQYAFFYTGNYFGIAIFSSTNNTYDANVVRFDEFINNIRIK